ncbi:MAG: TatD family hydrolase [Patescibacteria group bacterium]|jgi:TatD DNase family protein
MEYQLFDTHSHLQFAAYRADRDEVIERTQAAGVGVIVVGSQSTTSQAAVDLAKTHEGIWAAVGLHPNHLHAQEFVDENELSNPETEHVKTRSEVFDHDFYVALAKEEKVVAIGEFGLDYYRLPEGIDPEQVRDDQKKNVLAHFALANEVEKPVIIHCRDAHKDQYEMLRQEIEAGGLKRRGVIHCFTGTLEEAKQYLGLGFLISFTGILTFSKTLQEVAKNLPIESLMIETDAPYLAPGPYRGQRNEPLYVKEILKTLAQIQSLTYEEAQKITTENAKRFFEI